MSNLPTKVNQLPHFPGVYLMKDSLGRVIYVGKASDLKKRVASYFSKREKDRYQIKFLMQKVCDIETVVTGTEKEALLLENTLIKKHRPKYNIQLKDDKSYLSLKLSMKDRFPRLYMTRQIKKDGSLYFGPYASAQACRETVDFIERHFRLRTCSDHEFVHRSRPCLQHQIRRCDAPCAGFIDKENYGNIVRQVDLFLQGKKQDLLKILEREMVLQSEREEFEKAAATRNLIVSIRETLEKQRVFHHEWIDQDILGVHREGERVTFCLVSVREGKIWDTRLFHLKGHEESSELLASFLSQFYEERPVPEEVIVSLEPESSPLTQELLAERRGKKVSLVVPRHGDRRDLLDLAIRNAKEGFRRREAKGLEVEEILNRLQATLPLQNFPRRIECFDISNLGGKQAVGSLISFLDGEPDKRGYRRFRIRTVEGPDDYAMMKEVLTRRLLHEPAKWLRPDLMVIDGGRGQLQIAAAVLNELNLTGIDLAALAKAREGENADKVYLPGRKNPLRLPPHSSLLHLLMRIRDEAHRFAIAYHKKIREREFLP